MFVNNQSPYCNRTVYTLFIHTVDECSSSPCLSGSLCSLQANGYVCTCQAGFTGADCDTGTKIKILTNRYSNYMPGMHGRNVIIRAERARLSSERELSCKMLQGLIKKGILGRKNCMCIADQNTLKARRYES